MKNLYKVSAEPKFRGIFESPETPDKSIKIGTKEEFEETADGLLSRFGLDCQSVKDTWTLLFGDLNKVFSVLDKKASDKDNEEIDDDNSDENPAKNNDNNQKKQIDSLLEKSIEKGERLSAKDAISLLNTNISIKSTKYGINKNVNNITDREKTSTSLNGIRPKTINGINFLQKKINLPLVITGGTEDGHGGGLNGGRKTHGGGYKLDISFERGVEEKMDKYISEQGAIEQSTIKFKKGIGKGYTFQDGGYVITITKEIGVKGGDHYDIAFM